MLARVSKFIIGLLFVPVVIAISTAFFENLKYIGGLGRAGSTTFMWGVASYAVVHLFLFKPTYIYTLGHEVMHVLATWLCGGGVRSFNVSKAGGAVETTKSNFFISLSPYFVPTYTLLVSFLYFLLPFFVNIPNLRAVYFFLAGFTLSLHLIFTAEVLKMKQPDILKTGYLFSIVLIYIMNIALVGLVLCLLFEGVSFESFFYATYIKSKAIYAGIIKQLFYV